MPSVLFVIPGKIHRSTGGSVYDKKLAESLIEHGFRLEIVSIRDRPYFASLIAGVFIAPSLWLRLVRARHDLVIEDGWVHPAALLFNIVCRLTGKARLVIIMHQLRSDLIKLPLKFVARMVERAAVSSASLVVSVSRFIDREVEGLLHRSERTMIAPPGSDATSRRPCKRQGNGADPLKLLFVGNCTRLKGLDYLIRALALLGDLPLTLDVVGDISFEPRYYETVRQLARRLNVSERIIFHGAVSHERLAVFYSAADIFTFPSLYEGFGIVLGEAMHAGLPIVTTRVGAIDEIVREGENAVVVPSSNSEALAGAIRRLAMDPNTRMHFGQRSRELAKLLPTWKQTTSGVRRAILRFSKPDHEP